jgi:hypothetical protein
MFGPSGEQEREGYRQREREQERKRGRNIASRRAREREPARERNIETERNRREHFIQTEPSLDASNLRSDVKISTKILSSFKHSDLFKVGADGEILIAHEGLGRSSHLEKAPRHMRSLAKRGVYQFR